MVRGKRASGEEEIRVWVRENAAADCWIAEDRKAEGDCLRSRNRQAAGLSLQMEDHLNTMGYSDREEDRILAVFSRGLLRESPNPSRKGCPPSDVLRRIASHEMALSEAEKWLDHLGSCSPCYRDYLDLQAAYRKRLQWALFAVAAGILLSILVVGRILSSKHHGLRPAQTPRCLI